MGGGGGGFGLLEGFRGFRVSSWGLVPRGEGVEPFRKGGTSHNRGTTFLSQIE